MQDLKKYSSSKELKGKTLEYNDLFCVSGLEYQVKESSFCRYPKDSSNSDKIFKVLYLKNKEEYCKEHYRYDPEHLSLSSFPQFKYRDYEAATRLVMAFMRRWERWGWLFKLVG